MDFLKTSQRNDGKTGNDHYREKKLTDSNETTKLFIYFL